MSGVLLTTKFCPLWNKGTIQYKVAQYAKPLTIRAHPTAGTTNHATLVPSSFKVSGIQSAPTGKVFATMTMTAVKMLNHLVLLEILFQSALLELGNKRIQRIPIPRQTTTIASML